MNHTIKKVQLENEALAVLKSELPLAILRMLKNVCEDELSWIYSVLWTKLTKSWVCTSLLKKMEQ